MSRSAGQLDPRDCLPVPFISDAASLPGGTAWVTGTKRRHVCSSSGDNCSAYDGMGKRAKQEM